MTILCCLNNIALHYLAKCVFNYLGLLTWFIKQTRTKILKSFFVGYKVKTNILIMQ